jgi:hypothetical protein
MANLRRPTREFSFADHQRLSPNQPPPGHELDGAFRELKESLISTQEALSELRRDDGQLRNQLVGPEQLKPGLVTNITGDVTKITTTLQEAVRGAVSAHTTTAQEISLLAKDAEAAAISAQQWLSQIKAIESRLLAVTRAAEVNVQTIDTRVTDTENWYNYAKAQADNAAKSEDNALAWAEYLAGPVVSGPDAPAYIRQSPYPHGLFYQPIDGMGGMGGLWSAKWWAIYVQMLVGWVSNFYFGAWDHHPHPGEVNPDTGMVIPTPIPVGGMYFNTVERTLYIWAGDMWVAPFSMTGGVKSRFNYLATAGQTVFSGPDMFGFQPAFESDTQHEVHVNGVRLTRDPGNGEGDYTVDSEAEPPSMTLYFPVTADSIVQWDLLVSADDLRPGAAQIFKIDPITPDGIKTVFQLTYFSGTRSPYIQKPEELFVSLDGVIQEPQVDYTANDDLLTMYQAPLASSHIWAVYFKSGDLTELVASAPPVPVIMLSENRVFENALLGTVIGTFSMANPYTGTPAFHLLDDAGGKFVLVGNTLVTAGELDFETAVSHNIVVEVMGIDPPSLPRTFTIVVKDVFELVEGGIELTGNTVREDAIIGATIGVFSTVDTIGDNPVFSLLDNAGGKFFVSGNSLRVAAGLDFETASTYFIRVAVTGVLPPVDPEVFLIIVTPLVGGAEILLTGSSVYENTAAGAVVGTLSVSPGVTGTPVFTMVDNAGGRFVLEGNVIKTTGPFDYEVATSYEVTIAVTDTSPNIPARTLTIAVLDVFENLPPVITSTSSVANVENTVLAHALTGTDEQGITWSIVGGADMAHFEIVGSTLRWTGNGTKNFEVPGSSLGTNDYVVQVRATDPGALFVNQTITVTVTDVLELSYGVTFLGGQNVNMTLQDGNLGVRIAGNSNAQAIASTAWKRSGKYYFEIDRNDSGINTDKAGLAIEGATMAQAVEQTYSVNNILMVNGNGEMQVQGMGTSNIPGTQLGTWVQGEKVCIALDLDNFRFWARRTPTGLWNNNASANPATNVGGIDINYLSQTRVAPAAYFQSGAFAQAAKFIFNLGASAFSGAVPAGFTPGWSEGTQAALGHPTHTYLKGWNLSGNVIVEKGERLMFRNTTGGFDGACYVGLENFKDNGAGKFYVEFQVLQTSSQYDFWGFMTHDMPDYNSTYTQSYPATFCTGVRASDGRIYSNDAYSGFSIGALSGNVVCCAIDRANKKAWFRVGPSGLWNGQALNLADPANNIGGVSISSYDLKAMGPISVCGSTFGGHRSIFNAGQLPFAAVVPAGFTAGWPLEPADVTPPTITSSASISINENVALAHALTANETVYAWAIVGGTDQARFDLVGRTLRFTGGQPKNFEAPDDADANNVYQVIVRAFDKANRSTDQTINVTVLDVADSVTPLASARGPTPGTRTGLTALASTTKTELIAGVGIVK